MFRIKICGITSVGDALMAVEAGADAIGLNFYKPSPRCVPLAEARRIVDAVDGRANCVGVFVNEPAESISEIGREVALNTVQLHGDAWPDAAKLLVGYGISGVWIIRAHRFGTRGMSAVYEDMFDPSGTAADAMLVDASVAGMHGGTGQTIDWSRLVNYEQSIGRVPLVLAGGLTPENVTEAIRIVRPHGVDVASGIESSPGKKDHIKTRDFVAAARAAFAERER